MVNPADLVKVAIERLAIRIMRISDNAAKPRKAADRTSKIGRKSGNRRRRRLEGAFSRLQCPWRLVQRVRSSGSGLHYPDHNGDDLENVQRYPAGILV
jgi:hypothetical protein